MKWQTERTHAARLLTLLALVAGATMLLRSANVVAGEQRKFVVMLAHSPKAFAAGGQPGLPPAGLPNINQYKRDYFLVNPNDDVDSFAEYWEEVSYGNITISGDVYGWVNLPWAFEPNGPNGGGRPSPVDYINLYRNIGSACPGSFDFLVPAPYAYGAGEEFCDCFGSGDSSPAVSTADCGSLIIVDDVGDPAGTPPPPPTRRAGHDDYPVSRLNVWTPGERFIDIDSDQRWDSIDEVNDRMCDDPDGCLFACAKFVCSKTTSIDCRRSPCPFDEKCVPSVDSTDKPCATSFDCTVQGERCGDPVGSGPRGCKQDGCGNLGTPCIDWNDDGICNNQNNCVSPGLIPCTGDSQCSPLAGGGGPPTGVCRPEGYCAPANCVPPARSGEQVQLPPCCEGNDPPEDCFDGTEGVTCGTPILCCEFSDRNGNNRAEAPEPFEDFIVRWDPNGGTFASVWKPMMRDDAEAMAYIRRNYPGDAEALVARTGNGWYDSPDAFFDRGSTKMMQDAGPQATAYSVPKPGSGRYSNVGEQPWFDAFWADRYGTEAPDWPGGEGAFVGRNSPRMRPFVPTEPLPPVVRNTPGRRFIKPNRGGFDAHGNGTVSEPNLVFSSGGDNFDRLTQPDANFGYYDGWVEHDDLPSSKHHSGGDKRLGEITSPSTDTVRLDGETYTAIFGVDIGPHSPNSIAQPDNACVAAGPYAVSVHGSNGYDAGDVCITEWLTWRTDGASATPAYQWELDNGFYHPFAGLASFRARFRCSGEEDTICASDEHCGDGEKCTTRRCSKSGNYCKGDEQCDTTPTGGETCLPELSPYGFRDYNIDGMIDQGEVRPERSENYSVDSSPYTPNDGTSSDYPFNRQRMVEDIVAALDPGVDWDDFVDPNSMNAVLCNGGGNQTVVFDPTRIFDFQTNNGASFSKVITAQGFASGIVVVPAGSYTDINRFPRAPSFYPIHNEDNVDRAYMFPDWTSDPFDPAGVHKSFNLWFHDLVICANCRSPVPTATAYAAHEYGHSWQGYPDLYDYDVFNPPAEINCPVGRFDLMERRGSMVHFTPPLKNQRCSRWIEPVDLTTVLTPGVEGRITLPPVEITKSGYYFLDNEDRPGERYWFWSVGGGFDENLPSRPELGMLIMHFDAAGANPDALPLQQRSGPFSYAIIQADGRGDLEACESGGNIGDAGDIWPGTSDARRFGFDTVPAARWYTQDSWTGLDITDVEPDGFGSTLVTLTWTPSNIPSLRFRQPPGGSSNLGLYPVRYQVTDVHGGTTVRLYATTDPTKLTPGAPGVLFVGSQKKTTPGTIETSQSWNLNNVSDGRYYLFAKLVPGPGANQAIERSFTLPRASRNNAGHGTLAINAVDTGPGDQGKSRSETWTVRLFNIETDGTQDWLVYSTLTQPAPQNDPPKTKKCSDVRNGSDPLDPYPHLCLKPSMSPNGVSYTSKGGEVRFTLSSCLTNPQSGCPDNPRPFAVGDQFAFTTTGITAASAPVTVVAKTISAAPTAVVKAAPLSGSPPLTVNFDGLDSTDPNGAPLTYRWDFGDATGFTTGATVSHVYQRDGVFTAKLRVTNGEALASEAAVDIRVINNAPTAAFTATPTNGKAPLKVVLNASSSSDTETSAEALIYQWEFGDGMTANDLGLVGTQFQQIEHTYSKRANGTTCTAANPCTFTVKLTVTDPGGKKSSATATINAGNTNPTARVVASPLAGGVPLTVRFNASSSTDPDGDPLKVDWMWGDTNCAERDPDLVNVDIKGNTPAQDGTVEHIYKCVGSFNPRVVVKDGKGGESTFTGIQVIVTQGGGSGGGGETQLIARFRITPNPPLLNQDFTVDGSGSTGAITGYSWNWGDSTPASTGVSPTHRYTAAGSYTIVLTVSGANNASAQTSQRVTVAGSGTVEPPPDQNQAPTAVIVAEPTQGFVGDEFRFDGRRSTDADGDALTYSWTFGDGASGTGPQTTHTYSEPRTYTVRLTVRDTKNASTQATQNVQVVLPGENRAPVAIIATGPRTGTAPVALTFDGRNSYDLDGDPIAYLWEFQQGTGPVDDMEGQTVTRLFSSPGEYSVVLTVTDDKSASTVTSPVAVRISSPAEVPDGGEPEPPDTGGGEERPIPDSADQRPSACGVGMIMALFGSLVGLTSMRVVRRRRPS